jgi:hypothetical protein
MQIADQTWYRQLALVTGQYSCLPEEERQILFFWTAAECTGALISLPEFVLSSEHAADSKL